MTDIATYSHLQNQSPQNKEDSTHIDNDETLITKNEEVNNPNVHATQSALITYNDNNNTPQTVCINNTTTTNNNKPRQLFISSQVNLNKDDDINNKPTLSYAKTNQLLKEPFFVVKKSTSTNKTNVVDGNGCCFNKRNETKKCSVSCVNKKFNHFYIKSSCDDDADKDNNNSYNVGMYHRNDMFNFGVDVCKMNNDITLRNINYPITESNYNYSTYNNAIFNNKEISYNYLMNTNTNTSNTKYNNDNISMNNDKMMLNTTAITDNANNNIDNNNTKTENTSQMNNNNNTVAAATTRNAISSSFKECYIDLLITSATQLINNGLDVSALSNKKQTPSLCYSSDNDNNNNTNEPHKCDNKLCPVIFNKHNTSNIATMKSLNNKTIYLCINCFQAFQKEQYCYYCGIIYREYRGKKGFNDNKTWIGCDYCSNWEHVKCEETKGLFKNLSILIRDKQFKYRCPFCREKEKDIKQSLSSSSTTTSKAKHVTFNYINQKRKTINNSKASCLVGNGNGIKKKKQCNNDLYNDIQTILALDKNVQYLYNEKVD